MRNITSIIMLLGLLSCSDSNQNASVSLASELPSLETLQNANQSALEFVFSIDEGQSISISIQDQTCVASDIDQSCIFVVPNGAVTLTASGDFNHWFGALIAQCSSIEQNPCVVNIENSSVYTLGAGS